MMITLVPLSEMDRLEYEDEETCYWLHLNGDNVGSIKFLDGKFVVNVRAMSHSFKRLEEAESFVGRPFDSVLGDLVQRKIESWDSSNTIPCLAYFDSKYEFRRTKGGWFILNAETKKPVGSIGRGKYGRSYALYLNGLGWTYSNGDLELVKKKTVALLNGKEDLGDVLFTTWHNHVIPS